MRHALLAAALLFGMVASAWPDDSLDEIRRQAEMVDDALAQFNLGVVLFTGRDAPRDEAQAVEWFRRAAEQGQVDAQYALGGWYHILGSTPQDYTQAIEWYKRAVEQGHVLANYRLGQMYEEGLGGALDYVQAAEWYLRAAEQGLWLAQLKLGTVYYQGRSVPQDYVQAYKWAYIAEKAHPGEYHHEIRPGIVASRMTPEQLAEAQRLVREWTLTTE